MRLFASFLALICPLAAWAGESIFVGQYPSKIVPKQIQLLNLPEKSIISDISAPGRLAKDAVIARLNAEKIAEEKVDLELKILRDRITKTDALRDLEKKQRELKFYVSLSAKEREFETTIYKADDIPPEQAIKDLDARIDLAQKELERAEYTMRKDFAEKEKNSVLIMPFAGRLQYHVTLPDDTSVPFECIPVQQFATLCDDSAFYITIGITQTDLTQLPAEQFSVTIDLPAGKQLKGCYEYRRVERNGNLDMLVYYFRIPQADAETAFDMLGTTGKAKLYFESSGSIQRVSKAELSMNPHAENAEDWADLIKMVYPDHHILLEADKDVLIIPKGQEP